MCLVRDIELESSLPDKAITLSVGMHAHVLWYHKSKLCTAHSYINLVQMIHLTYIYHR